MGGLIMATSKLSPEQDARARKNYGQLMQKLASVGNLAVAEAIGVDESTISRMKPEKFQEFAKILAVLDLKIIPNEMKSFDEKEIAALLQLARSRMAEIESIEQLEWD
ncbi:MULTISPECIES: CII family transcriptional regulator [Pseudomonas]|uniref:CII family transcriptional regulator n=1 Tax=Pseudomonas TaxID=286 RepID=UPI001F254D93|nr:MULTISPECIES: CII family transcriptional regulator [Pseudomonas]MDD1981128.1 lambda phage CII family protein [Pseudomonas asiatica]MDD2077103.1 lambda phage CII family protein [Pseudomonas putida]MDM9601899.1 CII family transcriptional regulator [Pseudomonas shirazica]MDO2416434.1 CII family transcriptional regulator [Pseudomonas shirazica]